MGKWLISAFNFFLYSNLWIALAATMMVLQTQFILTKDWVHGPILGFVFSSTLILYAIHRLIGLSRASSFKDQGRYAVIFQYRKHIFVYALLFLVSGMYFFSLLQTQTQIYCIIAGLVAMGYVIPVFSQGRRLRDLNYLKIFLIALTWPFVTVFLTAMEIDHAHDAIVGLLFVEKLFFIYGITIPFDIRDAAIDQSQQIKTIPSTFGYRFAQSTAFLAFIGSAVVSTINLGLGGYYFWQWLAILISLIISYLLVKIATPKTHDYFFTGFMDGTMILQSILVILATLISV